MSISRKRARTVVESKVDDDDDFKDVRSDDGDDDGASLKDFIEDDEVDGEDGEYGEDVDDEDEDADGASDDEVEEDSEDEDGTRLSRDIKQENVVVGKRPRRQTRRFVDELYETGEVADLLLADVDDSELDAAINDPDVDDDEEDDDDDEEDDDEYLEESDATTTEEEEEENSPASPVIGRKLPAADVFVEITASQISH